MDAETADDKRKNKVDDILGYKNLIDNFPDNDFFLFPFMSMVLNLTDEKGFVSEAGMKLLHNDIQKDIDILKEREDDPSQYALCRLSLWYCLAYNILTLYCSFVASFGLEETKQYTDKMPSELKDYLKGIPDDYEVVIHEDKYCSVKSPYEVQKGYFSSKFKTFEADEGLDSTFECNAILIS